MPNHLCLRLALTLHTLNYFWVPVLSSVYKQIYSFNRCELNPTDVPGTGVGTRDTPAHSTDHRFSHLRPSQCHTLVLRLKISLPGFARLFMTCHHPSFYLISYPFLLCSSHTFSLLFLQPTSHNSGSGHLHSLFPFPEAVLPGIYTLPLFKCSLLREAFVGKLKS